MRALAAHTIVSPRLHDGGQLSKIRTIKDGPRNKCGVTGLGVRHE